MKFLKENWAKLLLAVVFVVGAILYLVPILNAPGGAPFYAICQLLAPLFFFVGMTVYTILAMFNKTKKAGAIVLLVTGLIATILFVIAIVDGGLGYGSFMEQFLNAPYLAMFIVLGIVTLISGVKKTLCAFSKKG